MWSRSVINSNSVVNLEHLRFYKHRKNLPYQFSETFIFRYSIQYLLSMASLSPSSSNSTSTPSVADLTKQLRLHEVALAELNNQPSSRAVYRKNGNLFFRTTIQAATAMEQKELESAKSKLKGLNSSS